MVVSNNERRKNGRSISTRCFFDQGSQRTFVSESLVKKLKLKPIHYVKLQLVGFTGQTAEESYPVVKLILRLGKTFRRISAVVKRNLPSNIQTPGLRQTAERLRRQYTLADKHLDSDNVKHVELIIGAEHYSQFITGLATRDGIDVLETPGGLVIYGPIPLVHGTEVTANHVSVFRISVPGKGHEVEQLEDLTPRMWDLTNMGISPDESAVSDDTAYHSFMESVKYQDNKYWVRLPWKRDAPTLPNNYSRAKAQALSQLRKLRANPEMLATYDRILQDQLKNGFVEKCSTLQGWPTNHGSVEKCSTLQGWPTNHHYLPHFSVTKDSVTTPIRLVYNASSKSPDGVSLNDCLLRGPNLTKLLLDTVLRARRESYLYSADISKAFLRLGLQEVDRDYTRFLWSVDAKNPLAELEAYRFRSVLFGATSSPFLLQVTLDLHLRTSSGQHREEILRNFYVDNLLGSTNSEDKLLQIYTEANLELNKADMPLRDWATNSPALTKLIQADTGKQNPFEDLQNVLGINWSIKSDTLSLKSLESCESQTKLTKRIILSRVSSLFDPLGLATPLTIKGKLLIQQAWKSKIGWDQELPEDFVEAWPEIEYSLNNAGSLIFPRNIFTSDIISTLHIFVDASTKAYGACAYVVHSGDANLLMSKAKVAPLKSRTLPQLELMALLVGARLAKYIHQVFESPFAKTYLWSDNEAVIQWVRNERSQITFVQNRVSEIRELTTDIPIHHVNTKQNPADFLTRGNTPEELLRSPLWFKGPNWLPQESEWPEQKANLSVSLSVETEEVLPEHERVSILPIGNYSSLNKLLNIVRLLVKFIKIKLPTFRVLQPMQFLIREEQRTYCNEVFAILREQLDHQKCKVQGKLIRDLGLYEDEIGVIRSRGRLANTKLPYQTKYPMLLPNKSHLAKLVVIAVHEQTLHGGVQETLTTLRQWCWIPKGRQLVKKLVNKCTLCRRFDARQLNRPGPPVLPIERVIASRPFLNTGVDYTGAITVCDSTSGEQTKVYIALFTCMVTRAVHLEVVSDLSALTFLHAFRRFVATCSLPQVVTSDHGTNLSATAKFLKDTLSEEIVQEFFKQHTIQWNFIHVRSPWEGGFYERLIGVTKSCLRKLLYRKTLTHQEITTLVAEVKARVNNRPLTYVESDQPLLESLTPSHLLCGRTINTMPPLELEEDQDPNYDLDHRLLNLSFSHLSKLLLKFEKNFEKEYLTSLRARYYGNSPASNISPLAVGDVVLLEAGTNRERWPLARVIELLPDSDGIVRAVKVISRGRLSTQTIGKLVHMEVREPAPPLAPVEVVDVPPQPNVPIEGAQRPQRAAAQRAEHRNRQLFDEALA